MSELPDTAVSSRSSRSANTFRLLTGLAAGTLLAALAITNVDWGETLRGLEQASVPLLLAALAVESLHYPVKTLRWWLLLCGRHRIPFRSVLRAHAAGCLLGDLSPARVGELARPLVVSAGPGPIDFPFAFGTAVAAKTTDLFLLGCLALASSLLLDLPAWVDLSLGAGGGGIVLVLAVLAAGGRRLTDRLVPLIRRAKQILPGRLGRTIVADSIVSWMGCIADVARPPVVGRHLALSVGILSMNLLSGYLVLSSAGLDVGLREVVLVQTLMSLAFILPSPPTYAGSVHFFVIEAVVLSGAGDASRGMTAGILAHLVEAGAVVALALACVPGMVFGGRPGGTKEVPPCG